MFSTAWTHRDSQNWIEKRRGREEIEVTWGRKRRVKRGKSNQASNHNPKEKMGTEDWILKGTKLITNTKKQRLKL